MKTRIALLLVILIMAAAFAGCQRKLKSEADFMRQAREILPAGAADTAVMQYAGFVISPNDSRMYLHWVVSGDEHEDHAYLALECERALPSWEYALVRSYEAGECMEDVAVLEWEGRIVFCVNNTDVRGMRWKEADGTEQKVSFEQFPYSSYPFLRDLDAGCTSVTFLDAEGNELPAEGIPD